MVKKSSAESVIIHGSRVGTVCNDRYIFTALGLSLKVCSTQVESFSKLNLKVQGQLGTYNVW